MVDVRKLLEIAPKIGFMMLLMVCWVVVWLEVGYIYIYMFIYIYHIHTHIVGNCTQDWFDDVADGLLGGCVVRGRLHIHIHVHIHIHIHVHVHVGLCRVVW